jgi:hypothetical protein
VNPGRRSVSSGRGECTAAPEGLRRLIEDDDTLMFAISSSRRRNFFSRSSSCSVRPLLGMAGGTIIKRRLIML